MWNSKKESLCVICDVGSATVSAGLFLFRKNAKPTVLFTTSVPISVLPKPEQSQLEKLMLVYLESAIKSVSTSGLVSAKKQGVSTRKISNFYIIFASPWFAAKATEVLIEKESAFMLDEKLIANAMINEESLFENEAIQGKFEQVKGKDIRMVEREMVAVKLNGYETSEPHDKRATKAELSLYMSLVPEHILDVTEKIAHNYFHLEKITFHTFPLIFFGAANKLFPHDHNYVLVDAAGESTDVSLVRNGIIAKSSSFAIGYNTMLRTLMEKLNISEEIAHSYLYLNESNNASIDLQKDIATVLDEQKKEWNRNFKNTIDAFTVNNKIPHLCLFISNSQSKTMYESRLKEIGQEYGITQVIGITSQTFVDYVEYGKFTTVNQFLSLEAVYIKNHDLREMP
jgi:hypothetical protein